MFDCTFGSPADHGALGSLPCPVEPGGCARALPIAQFFHAKQELPRILASSTVFPWTLSGFSRFASAHLVQSRSRPES